MECGIYFEIKVGILIYSNLINLRDFFERVDNYVILRLSESFPNYFDHSDVDILCGNRNDFLAHVLKVGKKYKKQGFRIKVIHTKSGHIHVDFYPPKARRLNIRFDLINCFSYKKFHIPPGDSDSVLDSREQIKRGGVGVQVPSLIHEITIRILENKEYPNKVKHLQYLTKLPTSDVSNWFLNMPEEFKDRK